MQRALKSIKAAGFDTAHVIFDLANRTIEIRLGDQPEFSAGHNEWDDE